MILAIVLTLLAFVLFWSAIARNSLDSLITSFVLGIVALTLWAVEIVEYFE